MTLLLPFRRSRDSSTGSTLNFPGTIRSTRPCSRNTSSAFSILAILISHNPTRTASLSANYSANVRVMGGTRRLAEADIKDGTSTTIMAGEIADRFPAWGQPGNWRDPALGVNHRPDGFGGPSPGGANFLFADGSVRFIKNSTKLQVLKALSTPAGAEPVNSDEY